MISIKVPTIGESITEVSLLKWKIKNNQWVALDEVIAELESEKATFEVTAEKPGILFHKAVEGETILIGSVLAEIDETALPPVKNPQDEINAIQTKQETTPNQLPEQVANIAVTPVAKNIIQENKIELKDITSTNLNGKISKKDVLNLLNKKNNVTVEKVERTDKVEKMSNIRKTISKRLVESKNTTAMLTTFNEVDMSQIMHYRTKYKDSFKEKHNVGLGFMSFFVKAVTIALLENQDVNAYIDNDSIIYHNYCDISIAVSTPKGLTVPVIRNAESLSMADIEKNIIILANKAKENKLTMDDLTGGTFTITNGGIFGSLLSTPIINLPQSAILGMHKIQD
ncbi:MAG: dihydrolipoyllysine-residue succinyltransferase, partial [Sediminibacterium sp.]|nr:dihydrolipoyllysine-residue succinyltransferase [Sediminibacterium sp.]